METQPRSLNTLYKLLWEQIKESEIMGLLTETSNMMFKRLISLDEKDIIDEHILKNKQPLERNKHLIQRMIKETDVNDNNVTNI